MQEEGLTKKDLEEVLDKKFEQYQGSILEAVDWKFQKMEQNIQFMDQKFEMRFQAVEVELTELRKSIRDLTKSVDIFLHRLDRWEQEFTLLKADVDKIKVILKEKLGVEVAIQG